MIRQGDYFGFFFDTQMKTVLDLILIIEHLILIIRCSRFK